MSSSTNAPPGIGQVDKSKRNPHDFKATEASRPDWNSSSTFTWTKTKNPNWTFGSGASIKPSPSTQQIPIDPHSPGRDPAFNYRLITSAVIPRPTAVISTTSADGTSTNLAPYSFFQAMSHDPPTFVIGHAVGSSSPKDSLRNLRETGECVINILTEDILEASNAAAMSTPYGVSEWALTGLTPVPCTDVNPSRIAEAVFSVECKLVHEYPIQSRSSPGKVSNVMTVVEGTKFWVREDVVDEERKYIDPAKSKPIGRLQGISYGRVMEGFQIPWPSWEDVGEREEREGRVRGKVEGQ
ncbi:Putative flavin reductase like domain, FMN-binding split barrel [Septoria linicola]|uniref:Flavin reductase like domain, FMN-binding split barrel n=1 Tax=Septoria linicola TaxID=215465 RepID=A0A9Q9ELX8_9PEZI|nr:Putative flavin reductase like domain, FMN-binding split barrel [Septoria linicola]